MTKYCVYRSAGADGVFGRSKLYNDVLVGTAPPSVPVSADTRPDNVPQPLELGKLNGRQIGNLKWNPFWGFRHLETIMSATTFSMGLGEGELNPRRFR